jgi:hypothetical protein
MMINMTLCEGGIIQFRFLIKTHKPISFMLSSITLNFIVRWG